jgi:hypothetical protein
MSCHPGRFEKSNRLAVLGVSKMARNRWELNGLRMAGVRAEGCLNLRKRPVVGLVDHEHHLENLLVLLRVRVEREESRLLLLAAVGELGFGFDARVPVPAVLTVPPEADPTRSDFSKSVETAFPRAYQRTNCFGDATRFPTILPTNLRISFSAGEDVTSGGLK